MSKTLTTRSYNFEVRAEDSEQGCIIYGRPIVFESKTDLGYFSEIIHRGALDKTDLTDVRFLVNHDLSKIPLARARQGFTDSTMKLSVDDNGLGIRVNLDIENNSEARNLYSAVKRGDITGMSFMFGVDDEDWEDLDTEYPTRHIRSISVVVEVSAVTLPAYEYTEINARNKNSLDVAKRGIEPRNDELELLKLKNEILGGI